MQSPLEAFQPWTYFLVLFSIASQFSIGRVLGATGFITSSLVGLSFSALMIGSLANVCAAPIRLVACSSIVLGWLANCVYFLKEGGSPAIHKKHIAATLISVAVALLLFLINNPANDFILSSPDGSKSLLYNSHFPFYGMVTTEMLNADYWSRLRIAGAYPNEWINYHFFNASTHAVARALLPKDNLFTYFVTQVCIILLVLASFVETWYMRARRKNFVNFISWIIIGFTVFHTVLLWNLGTNGTFSIFGAVHFVWALFSGSIASSMLYLLVIASSSFRLVPLAGIAFMLLFYFYYRKATLKETFSQWRSLNPLQIAFIAFEGIYNFTTVLSVPMKMPFLWRGIFWEEWHAALAGYRFTGYFTAPFWKWFGELKFRHYDIYGDFSHLPHNSPSGIALYAIGLLSTVGLIILIRKRYLSLHLGETLKKYKKQVFYFLVCHSILIFLLAAYWLTEVLSFQQLRNVLSGVFFYHVSTIPTVLWFTALFLLVFKREDPQRKVGLGILFAVFYFTFVLQYLGSDANKVPVAYFVFDILLWALFGYYLLYEGPTHKMYRWAVPVSALAIALIFPVRINSIAIGLKDEGHTFPVDITQLVRPGFKTEDWVDKSGFLHPTVRPDALADSAAAILGARIGFVDITRRITSYQFIRRDRETVIYNPPQ